MARHSGLEAHLDVMTIHPVQLYEHHLEQITERNFTLRDHSGILFLCFFVDQGLCRACRCISKPDNMMAFISLSPMILSLTVFVIVLGMTMMVVVMLMMMMCGIMMTPVFGQPSFHLFLPFHCTAFPQQPTLPYMHIKDHT